MRIFTGFKMSAIYIMALLLITGCNSSDNISQKQVRFIDSAPVVGLEYKCGTTSGKTDEDGAFTYPGEGDCSFNLGELSFQASQENLSKEHISTYDVTYSEDEAHALSSILHAASYDDKNRMFIIERVAKIVRHTDLSNGNDSVEVALGIENNDKYYVKVHKAHKLLSKNFDSNGTSIYKEEAPKKTRIVEAIAMKGVGIVGDKLFSMAGSEVMKALGFPTLDGAEAFDVVFKKLDEILNKLDGIDQKLDGLYASFDTLFGKIDEDAGNDYVTLFKKINNEFMTLSTRMNNYLKVAKNGERVYIPLDEYNPSTCSDLVKHVFSVRLTVPSEDSQVDVHTAIERWHEDLIGTLNKYFDAQEKILSIKLPEVGMTKSHGTVPELLDQYNESVVSLYATTLIHTQTLLQLHQIALYLTSDENIKNANCSKEEFNLLISTQTHGNGISYGHDYKTSIEELEDYYNHLADELDELFSSRIISDPINGMSHSSEFDKDDISVMQREDYISPSWKSAIRMDIQSHTTSGTAIVRHIPDGSWNDDDNCLFYQYKGFNEFNATNGGKYIQGDFDGQQLKPSYKE